MNELVDPKQTAAQSPEAAATGEEALRQSKALLDDILEHMDQGISVVDNDLRAVVANRRFRELLGFPESLCNPGTPMEDLIRYNAARGDYGPGEVEEQVRSRIALARRFEAHRFERERPDGTVLDIRGIPVPGRGFVTIYTDITQRASAERALRESEARFRSLTALSSDWFWEQDASFRFCRLEGKHASGDEQAFAAAMGKTICDLGLEIEGGWDAHRALLESHSAFRDVVLYGRIAGWPLRYLSMSGEPIVDPQGRLTGYRGVGRDITTQKRAEERIQYLATHDGLTGLPNRTQFAVLLNQQIQSARRYEGKFAVMFMDLDRFKAINDTFGHEAGDTLLKEMAFRFSGSVRASDVVARLGGDEFVVLIQEAGDIEQVNTVARKVLSAAIKPVLIAGQEYRVTASAGICMFPQDAQDEQTLMKNADTAMYRAKAQGKNKVHFYSAEVDSLSLGRMALESSLRQALLRGEFSLHYQAKLDLKTGAISGVEALLRWQHPELGTVLPLQFMALAEETGLIVPIGKWVLKTACNQNVTWQRQGLPPVVVSVNISARQFTEELSGEVAVALQASGMDPHLLELELNEATVMANVARAVRLLGALKQIGVRIAIDDFGTGYSSLAQINRLPIDTLKVDRSVIREIDGNTRDGSIAQTIIAMGKTLNLTVVASGVETPEQQAYLSQQACDEIQGYHFSRPVLPDALADLLRQHVPLPS
ncbi:MAG: EAL domain-containing protein [Burkholderiaceae bacterium]|nr:EAL domain-containing protein [Burkholderiaceae bacterium]